MPKRLLSQRGLNRAKIDPYSNITEKDRAFISADAARCAVIQMPDV